MSLNNLIPLRDPRPLYLQAEDALIRILADSKPGDQLPPEPELAQQLGVSRSTLREALRVLRDKGFVARKQGVGTFVQPRPPVIPSGLETLESLDVIARRLGTEVRTAQLLIEEREAGGNPELMERLTLSPSDRVIHVCRIRLADERPVAYIEDAVPSAIVSLGNLRAGFRGSVLDYLREHGNPPPDHARADIRALLTDEALATKLRVRRGTALLLLEEVLYSTEGRPIDFSRNYFVPGFFDFHVIRRIRQR